MLSILGLAGLAFAAALWPDTSGGDDETTSPDKSERAQTPDLDKDDILNLADAAPDDPAEDYQDELIVPVIADIIEGTDDDDVLVGTDGDDTFSDSGGKDTLIGWVGDDVFYGDDDAEGDTMIGGDGNDIFYAGAGDEITGGPGDDDFRFGLHDPVYIADFNPDDDKIILEYDANTPAPDLQTADLDDGIGLFADGKHVATFGGIPSLDLKDVHLVPEAA